MFINLLSMFIAGSGMLSHVSGIILASKMSIPAVIPPTTLIFISSITVLISIMAETARLYLFVTVSIETHIVSFRMSSNMMISFIPDI